MNTQKNLIDNFKKVCICRSITAATIMQAIRDGCLSFEALRRKIGVGTGNCKAKRCRQNIEKRVQDHKKALKAEEVETAGKET
ncbi:MAG: (2Fe-2S)-binding protein [Nitrospinaceae bacterium]|nr:MAG: (2Fe-2S)-binding protein [Nitrospinaceae bacterium]